MKKLIIYGCGSVGRMVEQIVFDINAVKPEWKVLGFIDDDVSKHGMQVAGFSVLGNVDVVKEHPDSHIAVAFSIPKQKQAADEKLQAAGVSNVATLVHPGAWISRRVSIGEGCIIYPGVHIDVDVLLGRFVLLNKLCTVGHDTSIGDYATAAPAVNLGGNCRVGKGFEFGINSATIQNLTLGEWSVLGAGGVAVKSLDAHAVYAGVPAKLLRPQDGLTGKESSGRDERQ